MRPTPFAERASWELGEREERSTAGDPAGYFEPETGVVLTHLMIVRDVDRSRDFYERALEATVVRERGPCVLRFHNSYIVLNEEGGPTDDKARRAGAGAARFLDVGQRDEHPSDRHPCVYERWRSRGGEFLTEPKDHELEIRCYLRDRDGYLIELGQGTGILAEMAR